MNNPAYAHPSNHPDGSDTTDGSRYEDFSAPFWTKVLLGGVIGAIFYRLNSFYTASSEVHPLTEWLGGFKKPNNDDDYEATRKWLEIAQREADDLSVLREKGEPLPISRIDFDGVFDRFVLSV